MSFSNQAEFKPPFDVEKFLEENKSIIELYLWNASGFDETIASIKASGLYPAFVNLLTKYQDRIFATDIMYLHQTRFLHQSELNVIPFLCEHLQYAPGLAKGLTRLYDYRGADFVESNKKDLLQHIEHAERLAGGIVLLDQCRSKFFHYPLIKTLIFQHAEYAEGFIGALLIFDKPGNLLKDKKILECLIQHPQYALNILCMMHNKLYSHLKTKENFYTLIQYREYLEEIGMAFDKRYFVKDQTTFNKDIQTVINQNRVGKIIIKKAVKAEPEQKESNSLRLFNSLPDPKSFLGKMYHFIPKQFLILSMSNYPGLANKEKPNPLRLFSQHPMFEPKLVDKIFDFLPKPSNKP